MGNVLYGKHIGMPFSRNSAEKLIQAELYIRAVRMIWPRGLIAHLLSKHEKLIEMKHEVLLLARPHRFTHSE